MPRPKLSDISSNITGALRVLAFLTGSLAIVPLHLVIKSLTGSLIGAQFWHAYVCRVFGIKVRHIGMPLQDSAMPTVFLANHLSYLDIVALGAHLDVVFVAKSEVEKWPLFGFLAKTQNTVFIQRKRSALEESKKAIADVLRKKTDIVLFGEGTSTDGRAVLPFKAGLLDILFDDGVKARLQPVAIVLEKVGGKTPDDQAIRDLYAWWRPETTLAPHLWAFAKAGGANLNIYYLPPLVPAQFEDRKGLAQAAQNAVAKKVAGQ